MSGEDTHRQQPPPHLSDPPYAVPQADPPPVEPHAAQPGESARTMGMACHLLGLVGFLGPLIIWLVKRNDHPFVDDQGKEALNFQLSILIYSVVSMFLIFVFIGIPLIIALPIFNLVMVIVAAVAANNGQAYRYPLCIRMIR